MACERNCIEITEHALQTKYLDLIPQECAVHLSDPLREQFAGGWTFEKMMTEIEEYFELRMAFAKSDGGMTRNRATWNNEARMFRAPLSIQAPPMRGAAKPTLGGPVCGRCGGQHSHLPGKCPNGVAEKDKKWQKMSDARKNRPCGKCKGVGHWSKHHGISQRAQSAPPRQPGTDPPGTSQRRTKAEKKAERIAATVAAIRSAFFSAFVRRWFSVPGCLAGADCALWLTP